MSRKLLIVGSLMLASAVGVSDASADDSPRPTRYEVQTPLSGIKAGAARVAVHAPIDVVRQVVSDYGGYGQAIKRFEKARVIGRHGDATDVYLQVPILKGAAKVWGVVRFEPAKPDGDGEVIVGRLVKGNVKRLDARWRISKIDADSTNLNLEILIVPDFPIPLPSSLVTGEAAFAADKAVEGMRNRSEQITPH
jgi:ribosome-associated toxin RatA of RatAB toxin-antitoxin module